METVKHSTYQDFDWAVRLNRFSLKLIGLWPKSKQTRRQKFVCHTHTFFVFLSILLGLVIPSIHSLIRVRSDIMLMVDNLQFTLPVVTSMLRIAIFWWKKEAVSSVLDMIADDWIKSRTLREKSMMIRRAQTARVIIMLGYGLMTAAFACAVMLPACGYSMRYLTNVTDPGRPLPLQTHYMHDVTKTPQYEFTFVSQVICMFLAVMPYTGIDNFLGLLVFHISGQLDILRNRLTCLHKFADFSSAFKKCATDHARLLRAIAIVEDTFNIMLLALFLYFGTLFAFYGFLMINLLEDKNDLSVSRLVYLISIVINLFGHMCVYCVVGEILTAQCNHIHYAVYDNEWYNLDSRNIRSIIFLMVRASKPLNLTAGKIFPLTMATFCNLIKTSAGYISVLLTTRY